jgi:enoyl-CoA hydratase
MARCRNVGEVRLSVDAGVAVVTVDSPEVRNGITPEMADSIVEHCEAVDADPGIGALVVTGANGTFCSGADTRRWDVQADPAAPQAYDNSSRIYRSFLAVGSVGVPTIAAGEGAAVGAGLNLFLAADLRVVARNMRLIAGFPRAGIHPGGGFFSLVGRRLGSEGAAAMGLFDQEVSGERAAATGLAWELVEPGEALARALEVAGRAARDPELSRRSVRSMRLELGPPQMPWAAAVELERGVQMWSFRRAQRRNPS